MKKEGKLNSIHSVLQIAILVLMVITISVQLFLNHINYGLIAFFMGSVVLLIGINMILDIILKKKNDLVIHIFWLLLWLINFAINLSRAL